MGIIIGVARNTVLKKTSGSTTTHNIMEGGTEPHQEMEESPSHQAREEAPRATQR